MISKNVVEMPALHQERRELCSAPMINGSVEPIIHHNALATRVKVMARRVRISTTKINLRNQTKERARSSLRRWTISWCIWSWWNQRWKGSNQRKSKIIPTEMDNQLVHMVLVEPKVERLQPNIRKINIKKKKKNFKKKKKKKKKS